jgi:hypothetical protein
VQEYDYEHWFSIDPQLASINPTINISIVFICAFLVDCGRIIRHLGSRIVLHLARSAHQNDAAGLIESARTTLAACQTRKSQLAARSRFRAIARYARAINRAQSMRSCSPLAVKPDSARDKF